MRSFLRHLFAALWGCHSRKFSFRTNMVSVKEIIHKMLPNTRTSWLYIGHRYGTQMWKRTFIIANQKVVEAYRISRWLKADQFPGEINKNEMVIPSKPHTTFIKSADRTWTPEWDFRMGNWKPNYFGGSHCLYNFRDSRINQITRQYLSN